MASTSQAKSSPNTRDEIISISRALLQVHDRLLELAKTSEEIEEEKLTQLEEDNARLWDDLRLSKALSIELERKAKSPHPEVEKALQARDAAQQKLRRARRVIKDLVEEREREKMQPGVLQVEGNELRLLSPLPSNITFSSLHEISSPGSSTTSPKSSSAGSERTIRGETGRGGRIDTQTVTSTHTSPKSVYASPSGASPRSEQRRLQSASPGRSARLDVDGSSDKQAEGPSSIMSAVPDTPLTQHIAEEEMKKQLIYYGRPPRSASLCRGPLSWNDLQRIFGLSEDMILTLRGLESAPNLCLRVHILKDAAFVYDPIFLDLETRTFLVDWGRKEDNERIANFIKRSTRKPIYNTFVFPKNKGSWFYIGGHTWTVSENEAVWPTLGPSSQGKLISKLSDRCDGAGDGARVGEMLETTQVEQICIHLSDHPQLSQAYATRMLKA
ncbi:hypothetical protein AX17_001263 [Amanita inopinata Kibby_2008]|nr:hypothetical protein AX17_001263 [Amanita inopinata Kibby_2008]